LSRTSSDRGTFVCCAFSLSVSSLDTGIYLSLHRGLLVLSLAASTRTITTSSSVRWCSLPSSTPTFVCLSEHVSGNF
jgi:hypothetical protein